MSHGRARQLEGGLPTKNGSPGLPAAIGEPWKLSNSARSSLRSTGRVYRDDWVHAFKLRSGKIVEFREYTDTATIVEALAQDRNNGPDRIDKYIFL